MLLRQTTRFGLTPMAKPPDRGRSASRACGRYWQEISGPLRCLGLHVSGFIQQSGTILLRPGGRVFGDSHHMQTACGSRYAEGSAGRVIASRGVLFRPPPGFETPQRPLADELRSMKVDPVVFFCHPPICWRKHDLNYASRKIRNFTEGRCA